MTQTNSICWKIEAEYPLNTRILAHDVIIFWLFVQMEAIWLFAPDTFVKFGFIREIRD